MDHKSILIFKFIDNNFKNIIHINLIYTFNLHLFNYNLK
jgi:hypothetical protein